MTDQLTSEKCAEFKEPGDWSMSPYTACATCGVMRRDHQKAPLASNERAAFEAWCSQSALFLDWTRFGDGYAKPRTDLAWTAWKAARAAAETNLTEKTPGGA